MMLSPAVIIHGLGMARAALEPGLPLTFLSAPGAGVYAGVGWWREVIEAAAAPAGTCDILDCGDAPGRALEALRRGQKHLLLQAEPAIWEDVADRAEQVGATLLARCPDALDLGARGAFRRLAAWLAVPEADTRGIIG